jgi:hypothetical protein
MNRGHVTFRSESSAFVTVNLGNVVVAIIERGREVRGCAPGLTAADWAVVNEYDCPTGSRKQICSGHPRYPRADHAHVCAYILRERLELRDFGGAHPDGGRVTRVALHNFISRKGLAWRVVTSKSR